MKLSTLELLTLAGLGLLLFQGWRQNQAVARADTQIVRAPRGSVPGLTGAAPADPIASFPVEPIDGPLMSIEDDQAPLVS